MTHHIIIWITCKQVSSRISSLSARKTEMLHVSQAMEGFVVSLLNIGKNIIPCACMFGFLHAYDMHMHRVDDLYLTISLGVEGSGFGELGVQ
jgi:hypothetical protein